MPGAVPESGTGYHAIHMLTPESDKTTHFFTAVRFNVLTADELNASIQDKISTTRRFAFEEQDAPVIEAEIIDAALTPVNPVILAIDVGPVRYKQILQKLIRDERRLDGRAGREGLLRRAGAQPCGDANMVALQIDDLLGLGDHEGHRVFLALARVRADETVLLDPSRECPSRWCRRSDSGRSPGTGLMR